MAWVLVFSLMLAQYIGPLFTKGAAAVFQTPGFVSEVSKNSTLTTYNSVSTSLGTRASRGGTNSCVDYGYCFFYAEQGPIGDTGIVSFTYSSSPSSTPSVADDGSNTYNCSITNGIATDGTVGRKAEICVGKLTTAARVVRVTFGTSAVTDVQGKAALFTNLDGTVDVAGQSGGTASSATANAVSVTTTQNNDLVYQFVCRTGTPAVTSFTQGSGMTFGTTEIHDGCATQWQVATSSGSVTPSLTMASASTYNEVVVALKASSSASGVTPSGFYLERYTSWSSAPSIAGPFSTQFPSAGNLLVNTDSCAASFPVTGVSGGGNSSKWLLAGANNPGGGVPTVSDAYAPSASADSAAVLSVATTGTGDCTVDFYSFSGAPGGGKLVTRTGVTGGTASGTTVTITNIYLPWSTSGLTILIGGEVNNTGIALSGPVTSYWDAATYGGENIDGPQPIDENNMYAHAYVSATGNETWTYTLTATGTGPGGNTSDFLNFLGSTGIGIVQSVQGEQTTSSTVITNTSIPATVSGNLLVVSVGNYDGGTVRTISKVCMGGNTTCSTGTQFTQFTSAASTGVASAIPATDIWYLLSAPAAGTRLDVVASGTTTNLEYRYWEVQKGAGGSWATDGANHTNNSSANPLTCPAITTTGTADFGVGHASTAGGISQANNPNPGNEFIYAGAGTIFTNTSDAATSLLTTSASSHQVAWNTGGAASNCSVGFFK
jgi:hypothetical protein